MDDAEGSAQGGAAAKAALPTAAPPAPDTHDHAGGSPSAGSVSGGSVGASVDAGEAAGGDGEADAVAELEHGAATSIQAVIRGFLARKRIAHWMRMRRGAMRGRAAALDKLGSKRFGFPRELTAHLRNGAAQRIQRMGRTALFRWRASRGLQAT